LYRDLVNPVAIVRTAFRYINYLELPYHPGDSFRRFLAAPPEMPNGAPQQISDFLTRLVTHEDPDVAVVTQKLDAAPTGGLTPITIDIDVFFPGAVAAEEKSIAEVLQRLRELKNRLFFALLTDEAVELYT
jgi:uncharacterized protein (TIGR04255 family)